jgi:hypothetical protein
MMDKVNNLLQYAVEQCGRDRHYEVSFGADMKTPIVCVTEPDGTAIYGVRFEGDEICKVSYTDWSI